MSCIYVYLRKIFISRQFEVREAARAAVVCFVIFVLLGAAQARRGRAWLQSLYHLQAAAATLACQL